MTTAKANKITSDAKDKIKLFNEIGLHYNLVADSIYKYRKDIGDPFSKEYLPYIIAGLVSFDMGRMMGPAKNRYDKDKKEHFAGCLEEKLQAIKCYIGHLTEKRLTDISIDKERNNISEAYRELKDGLNQRGNDFHVGATKILHFINPELFVIVDSNASRAFKRYHNVNFINTTQPGYTVDNYIKCMGHAKQDIHDFDGNFTNLDISTIDKKRTPIARIYDKLTFITGSDIKASK